MKHFTKRKYRVTKKCETLIAYAFRKCSDKFCRQTIFQQNLASSLKYTKIPYKGDTIWQATFLKVNDLIKAQCLIKNYQISEIFVA